MYICLFLESFRLLLKDNEVSDIIKEYIRDKIKTPELISDND